MMATVYNMLCICIGKPPKTFDFEWRDKDGNFHRDCGLTPKQFYDKYIGAEGGRLHQPHQRPDRGQAVQP